MSGVSCAFGVCEVALPKFVSVVAAIEPAAIARTTERRDITEEFCFVCMQFIPDDSPSDGGEWVQGSARALSDTPAGNRIPRTGAWRLSTFRTTLSWAVILPSDPHRLD